MKEVIRQRAFELGFDACRFTSANPPVSAEKLQSWLADKNHGEMTWLERNAEKRGDPKKVLPDARNIIALATSYTKGNVSKTTTQERRFSGVVARYAQFDDYHDVLAGRLKELTHFVDESGGAGK